jgi:macrolide transport system ATP-binding/permease protein
MLLTVTNLSKAYGHLTVLNGVSFTVAQGQRVGLVGANGAGKSTLLKIMVGDLEADSGSVTIPKGVELGYLPQVIETFAHQSVQGLIEEAVADITALERTLREIEQRMATATDATLDALLADYGTLTEQFEQKGGYDLEHRIAMVLDGMQVNHLDKSRPAATLSGGEKARVGLALLLLRQPDLLLLDEPTNHLDLLVLSWLEGYVQGYSGGVMVVSHDRRFLNNTVTTIIELDERTHMAKPYTGNYDAYLIAKQQERERWIAEYVAQQEELKELRQALRDRVSTIEQRRPMKDNDKMQYDYKGARAQQSRGGAIQAVKERIARIEADPVPRPPAPLRINPDFDPQALANRIPLWASGLTKAFGERGISHPTNFMVNVEDRIVIAGANGMGKSTLLKVIAGIYPPDAGELYVAPMVKIGYLDQEQESLDLHQTLFDAYAEGFTAPVEQLKAELFHYGLFVYDDLAKKVGELSIGQRRKLQLARLIAARANLLLLDEPTNHLSFEVLEEFEAALVRFPGPILAASHDRYFIERFATRLWEVKAGRLVEQNDISALSISQRRVA